MKARSRVNWADMDHDDELLLERIVRRSSAAERSNVTLGHTAATSARSASKQAIVDSPRKSHCSMDGASSRI